MEGEYSGSKAQDKRRAPHAETNRDGDLNYLAGDAVLGAGTRNCVWQCWHLTILPRTSSGTTSSLRHLRLGQISWTAIMQRLQCIIGRFGWKLESGFRWADRHGLRGGGRCRGGNRL